MGRLTQPYYILLCYSLVSSSMSRKGHLGICSVSFCVRVCSEKFEDMKWVIRSRKSQNKQFNGQTYKQ